MRVLVVDDQRLIREGIASLLDIQPGISVVGTAADGRDAVEQARALSPDVVLMDVRMPVMDGVEATAAIREHTPTCRILVLSTFDDDDYIAKALQAGASGYLLKDITADNLAHAVHLAHAGVSQFDSTIAGKLFETAEPTDTDSTHASPAATSGHPLTSRELEVLRLIAAGATNREIAERLVVSEGTVKNHVSHILNRLGLRGRTQAAIYAHAHNLL